LCEFTGCVGYRSRLSRPGGAIFSSQPQGDLARTAPCLTQCRTKGRCRPTQCGGGPTRGGPVHACCGHRTLPERGMYDRCQECGWEDDSPRQPTEVVQWGPDGGLSLQDARAAYVARRGSPPTAPFIRIDPVDHERSSAACDSSPQGGRAACPQNVHGDLQVSPDLGRR